MNETLSGAGYAISTATALSTSTRHETTQKGAPLLFVVSEGERVTRYGYGPRANHALRWLGSVLILTLRLALGKVQVGMIPSFLWQPLLRQLVQGTFYSNYVDMNGFSKNCSVVPFRTWT